MIGPDMEKLAEQLSAYLDGELPPQQRQEVEAKLRDSAPARRLLSDLSTTVKLVGELPRHPAPPAVVADLRTQLERSELLAGFDEAETSLVTERPGWLSRLSLAAMIGLAAVGGWWMMATPDSPTSPARERSARVVESTAELEPTADLETKLAAGIPRRELRQHPFGNEPIRLVVPVRYESEQAALLSNLSRRLASASAVDLENTGGGDTVQPDGFFFRGRARINHGKGSTRQLLVRVSPKQLEELLGELVGLRNASDIRLRAGALSLRGSQKVETALGLLLSPETEDPPGRPGSARSKDQRLEGILADLGVAPETFLESPTDLTQPAAPTALAMKRRARGPAPDSLAERRSGRSQRTTPSPASVSGDETSVTNKKLTITGAAAPKQPDPRNSQFVTFVIEVPIQKSDAPETPRASTPGKRPRSSGPNK